MDTIKHKDNSASSIKLQIAFIICCLLFINPISSAPLPHKSFNILVNLTLSKNIETHSKPALLVLASEKQPFLKLDIYRNKLILKRLSGQNTSEKIWDCNVSLNPGNHTLLLKQRKNRLDVCMDNQCLGHIKTNVHGKFNTSFHATPGIKLNKDVRIQRINPIYLTDDFAASITDNILWKTISGQFLLNGSRNPGSNQNAFQLWGNVSRGEGFSFPPGTYWFWDNYRLGISVQAAEYPCCLGLIFYYSNPDSFFLFRWSQNAGKTGTVELIRRHHGKDEILGKSICNMSLKQWYRMTVVVYDSSVKCFINGKEIIKAKNPHLIGGKVGLYLKQTKSVFFDDLTVKSVGNEVTKTKWKPDSPFGPCEQQRADFSGKQFHRDRFMVQWSHPHSFWSKSGDLFWFRTRFFQDVDFSLSCKGKRITHWPKKTIKIILFGNKKSTKEGYHFIIDHKQISLSKNEHLLVQKKLDTKKIDSLNVSSANGDLICKINGKEIINYKDQTPILQGSVAADIGNCYTRRNYKSIDWRDCTRITSSHHLDYSFENAPTAWWIQSGNWGGTHRWACVPKWSFFSGRGLPGAPGVTHGNATLWNLRRFQGDFDLELFIAPMEGTPQRVHFSHPVVLNVAFCAKALQLDSGYMLLFGTYDVPTRLFKETNQLGICKDRVNPALRLNKIPWYRMVTSVWQHIRIQRRKNKITVDLGTHNKKGRALGLKRVFDIVDPSPPSGEQFALWTWGDNGVAIARATISYENSPGIATPAETFLLSKNQNTTGNIKRITNPTSGGSFCYPLSSGPINLSKKGILEFDFKPDAQLVLSLLLSIRGHIAEFILSGPERYRKSTVPLGSIAKSVSPEKWQHIRIDLYHALKKIFPSGPLIADKIVIASPYETLEEIAGIGINRYGDGYDISGIKWHPPKTTAVTPGNDHPEIIIKGLNPLSDFEYGLNKWTRLGGWGGATLYRDSNNPADGGYSLRLLNQLIAGPAGAWILEKPYNLSAFPKLSFDYRLPKGVEVNLIIKANGRWYEIVFTGIDCSWPIIGSVKNVKPDNKWHHAEIELYNLLRKRLRTDKIRIDMLGIADTYRMTTWQNHAYWLDNCCLVPAIPLKGKIKIDLKWASDKPVAGYSYVLDNHPETLPIEKMNGQGKKLSITGPVNKKFLHIRICDQQKKWSIPIHLPIVSGEIVQMPPVQKTDKQDTTTSKTSPVSLSPSAPFITYLPSDHLCLNKFEWQKTPEFPEQHLGEFSIRREAWVLPCKDDGATGKGCIEFVNLSRNGFFSGYLKTDPWNPLRWPMVAFDYKFEQPGCALNLSMLVNQAMTIVEWTGANIRGNYFYSSIIGSTPVAKQDRNWHHVEFNLLKMLQKRFPNVSNLGNIEVSELSTWATNHRALRGAYLNPLGARVKFDNFIIFSDKGNNPAFEWKTTTQNNGFSYLFDQNENSIPPTKIMTTKHDVEFKNISPGTWYFHVRACDKNGKWGPTGHRRIILEPNQ